MNANTVSGLIVAVALAVAGCNKAETPTKVQSDITKASDAASTNDARAAEHEAKVDLSASNAITKAQTDADAKMNAAGAATTVTEAQGVNTIALAKCEGLSGDMQSACKEEAKAALDMAKARANIAKRDHN